MAKKKPVVAEPPAEPKATDTLKPVPPEQKVIKRTEEESKWIVEKAQKYMSDPPAETCCATLVLARQLYYLGLESLRARMTELGHKPEDGVEVHLVESMANEAKKPFERRDVVERIQSHGLPWLMATMASENEAEKQRVAEADDLVDEHRRKLDIPIGYVWDNPAGDKLEFIIRDRIVVFAGHQGATSFLFDTTLAAIDRLKDEGITSPRPKVLRLVLTSKVPNLTKPRKGHMFREVTYNRWVNRLDTPKNIIKTLGPFLNTMRNGQLDLLLIDDLTQVMKPMVYGASGIRTAGSALRNLRVWADNIGCAILAAVPWKERLPELANDKDWEQLEIFSTLRGVSCVPGPYDPDFECDTYEIHIGNQVAVGNVDRAVIDGNKT